MPNKKGFTLIELLVVIVILAILGLVALVAFSGQQKRVRDTKRRADLRAIVNALEAKRFDIYLPLDGSDFVDGKVPTNDFGAQPYCLGGSTTTTAPPVPTSVWGDRANPPENSCYPNPPYTRVNADGTNMLGEGLNVSFRICAVLEFPSDNIYCIGSSQ